MLNALLQPLTHALAHFRAPRHPLTAPSEAGCPGVPDDLLADTLSAEDRVSAASGWHDSSWELQCGLAIRECPMDRVQRQVPLSWLLEA